MNLIIDEGNTNAKVSIYSDGIEYFSWSGGNIDIGLLGKLIAEYHVKASIYCSTRIPDKSVCEFLGSRTRFVLFDTETKVPLVNKYKTPETLGRDRLAACAGANFLKPNEDLLIIDIGTAITYDFVSGGVYLGGNIAPGMQMRLDALHHFTARLPQVDINAEYREFGDTTETAMYSGCKSGIIYEIEGYYRRQMLKYPKVSVFLTGGGAKYFVDQINFEIFAKSNLVQVGLEQILMYQC
ncbi:MAG: type III pantothenate kinase [Paludibacteraceae bacterium]|nr:type III pantothenate kinase [Paludibacteraceae bacterium]